MDVEHIHAPLPKVSDAAKLPRTLQYCGVGDVAFDVLNRLGTSDHLVFGAQYPCPHAPLPTLHPRPHGRRCTARGETWLATPFVSRDFHPLPFHQFAWHSKHPAGAASCRFRVPRRPIAYAVRGPLSGHNPRASAFSAYADARRRRPRPFSCRSDSFALWDRGSGGPGRRDACERGAGSVGRPPRRHARPACRFTGSAFPITRLSP